MQYVTEKEFDAGLRIQNSKDIAWSPEIKPGDKIRRLTFEQAFYGAPIPATKTTQGEDGARQPATAPESKPNGKEKPKPESDERAQ